MNLLITELENLYDKGEMDNELRCVLDSLLNAINDWPDQIMDIKDYLNKVENYLAGIATRESIEKKIMTANFSKEAWVIESFAQLIDVFIYYPNEVTLEGALQRLLRDLQL